MMRTRKGHKVYPLTVAQKFHLYYAPHCPSMAVLNIGTSLTIEVELDFDQLRKSINEAYARSEGMRIRFAKDKDGTWYQYIADPEEQEIELVDLPAKQWKRLRPRCRNGRLFHLRCRIPRCPAWS